MGEAPHPGLHARPESPPRPGGARSELREALDLLRSRRFGTFWFASLLSNIGTWAQQVAEPWLLLSVGASPFLIGLDSFAMNAPVWLLTLVGGVLADRRDRRHVITLFQSIQMLCPAMIVVLIAKGSVPPLSIVALSLVVGITDALSMPSFQSIVASTVEREQIGAGLALNSTQFNLSRILGPAIAGVLMATAGAIACFALSAASYVPFIAVALWILPRRSGELVETGPVRLRDLFAGITDIVRAPHVRGALLTVLTTGVLSAPLMTFSPVLVRKALHGDATQFSAVVGCFGVGGLLGATGLLAVPRRQDRRLWSSHLAIAHGVVVVLAALSPSYVVLPVLMVLAGTAMAASNISANSLLQATASPRLLGQTVSLFMLATRGGLSVGALLTGLAVDALGVRHALLLDGVLAVVVHFTVRRAWLRAKVPGAAPSGVTLPG
jgi:predicted MFS family arabinose efflux permease